MEGAFFLNDPRMSPRQTKRIEQQTDKQEQGHATVDDSLVKVQCGTIHAVGSFGWLALTQVLYLSSAKGAELYFVIGGRKDDFPAGWFKEASPQ